MRRRAESPIPAPACAVGCLLGGSAGRWPDRGESGAGPQPDRPWTRGAPALQSGAYAHRVTGHDPEQADRTVRQLADTTDAELIAGIRAALAEVAELAQVWRQSPHWATAAPTERRAYEATQQARAALAELGDAASVAAAVDAVRPVLGCWWPSTPAPAGAAGEAVERLRAAAMHRPSLVRDARQLADQVGE